MCEVYRYLADQQYVFPHCRLSLQSKQVQMTHQNDRQFRSIHQYQPKNDRPMIAVQFLEEIYFYSLWPNQSFRQLPG